MRYKIYYFPGIKENMRYFPPDIKQLVRAALEEIEKKPHAGTPLERELSGLWKYRAKRYRIVYEIVSNKREIIVLLIDKRETVYDRLKVLLANS